MAVAAAEVIDTRVPEVVESHPQLPLVFCAAEVLPNDDRAERFIRRIGEYAVGSEVEYRTDTTHNLMDAIRQAAGGSETARRMIETNVRTDVIERTIKTGHVTKAELEVGPDGSVMQHGQTMEAIQANTLRYASHIPQMRRRAEAETRNAFRIDTLRREGWLEDYNFVVFSRAADDMNPEEMERAGFFTETMSVALQLTTSQEGTLVTESAFVAGKKAFDEERHDKETIRDIGSLYGVDLDKPATEVLDTPLLIHKTLMPNGAIDLVKIYDKIAGDTFFGEDRPHEDYSDYRRKCEDREATYETHAQSIVDALISETKHITSPVMATRRLHELSGRQMVAKAVEDASVNSRVFGVEAAWHIEHARWLNEQGDDTGMNRQIALAAYKETSNSCPSGMGGSNGGKANGAGNNEISGESSTSDNCDFVSKECPKCHKKNVKTVVRKGRYYGACGCKS